MPDTQIVKENLNIIEAIYKPPTLEPAPLKKYFFEKTEEVMIPLGSALDPQSKELNHIVISVDLGQAATFLTYDKDSNAIVQSDESRLPGIHNLLINVTTSGYEN